MGKNRFLLMNDYLTNSSNRFKVRDDGYSTSSSAKVKPSNCLQVKEEAIGGDEFITDVLAYFFEEKLATGQLNDLLKEIAAKALWAAAQGSLGVPTIPRPSEGKPSSSWLITDSVQVGFRRAQNQCALDDVRRAVKVSLKSDYDNAKVVKSTSKSFWGRSMSNSLTTSDAGIDFIKQFEKFIPKLYNDPAGHCTIGYGTLVHKGNCDGTESDEFKGGISEVRATELLKKEVANIEKVVNSNVKIDLNQNQFDALVSFAYNVGTGAFLKSTLLKKLNSNDLPAVPTELKKWVNAGGKKMGGLVKRRDAEADMFVNAKYGEAKSLDEMYYRQMDTPRGIRNNNPGNIVLSRSNKWDGKVDEDKNTDGHFEQFKSYAYGVRALILLLRNYMKSGRNSITSIFSIYAPPDENNTQSYIKFVAGRLGVKADDKLDIKKNILKELSQAIAKMENGQECISDDQFEEGYNLLSDEVKKSIAESLVTRAMNRYEYSFSANERVLVVLMENGGIDLGIGELADKILSFIVPGSSLIPNSVKEKFINYLDNKFKEVTDNLLETAELTINRYSKAKPDSYGEIIILRDSSATYQDLKNTLIQQSQNGKIIDLFILTHGGVNSISLKNDFVHSDEIRKIKAENGGKPIRLRAVHMMNCEGSSLNDAWLEIGAKVTSGSVHTNYLPEPSMFFFWRNWLKGESFLDAEVHAYQSTIEAIKSIIRTAGDTILPVVGGAIATRLADLENQDFIKESAPVIKGDGSLTINSDVLSFSQSKSRMAVTVIPMGALV